MFISLGPVSVVGKDLLANGSGVSTVEVSDGLRPFETAIIHPEYDNGEIIVVEAYVTRSEAETGHRKWKRRLLDDDLPDALQDCQNSKISRLLSKEILTFKRQRRHND